MKNTTTAARDPFPQTEWQAGRLPHKVLREADGRRDACRQAGGAPG